MGLAEKLGLSALSGGYSKPVVSAAESSVVPVSLPAALPVVPVAAANENVNRHFSAEQESVLKLLADGFLPVTVASTLGISESAVSQYLAIDSFREELGRRKQVTLRKYKEMDDSYDTVEAALLEKLKNSVMFFSRPGEIVSALEKVNKMRRRVGASEQTSNAPVSQIVNISMPAVFVHKFITTKEGHVVGLDDKSLLTIQSNTLNNLVRELPNEVGRKDIV